MSHPLLLPKSAQGSRVRSPFGKTTLGGGLVGQANAMTQIKYGPEIAALAALLSNASQTYHTGVGQNRAAAEILGNAARQAMPGLADQTKRILDSQGSYMQKLGANAAARGGDPSALNREAQIAGQNLGLTGQSAQAVLARNQVDAASSANYQNQRLLKDYQDTQGQVGERYVTLKRESGDYGTLALKQLPDAHNERVSAANQKSLDRANRLLVANIDPTGKLLPGSPKDVAAQARADAKAKADAKGRLPGGAKALSTGEQNRGFSMLDEATTWFDRYKGKVPGSSVRAHLLTGSQTVDAAGNKVSIPKVPKWFVNAAESISYLGGLSPENVRQLHSHGYKVAGKYKVLTPEQIAVKRGAKVLKGTF